MRESIGGSMLFWIVLFFLSIFIIFIASIIRYARVYKIKNSMINYVERNEGIENKNEIDSQLSSLGYSGAYKICRYFPNGSDGLGGYYYLELYAVFELPIAGKMFHVDVMIKGDTYLIKTGTKIKSVGGLFTELTNQCKTCSVGGSCS